MAKVTVEVEPEGGIIRRGEAARLIEGRSAARVQGVGVPPLTELMDFLVQRDVRISV